MIVDHANGLHERITDRRAYESEAPFLEVFAQGVRLGGLGRYIAVPGPMVDDGSTADERPHVTIEGAFLASDTKKRTGIGDRAFDLEPVANDSGVAEKSLNTRRAEARHLRGIESGVRGKPLQGHGEQRALRPIEGDDRAGIGSVGRARVEMC